jgi:[ribosomal protein S18]-alanine N-acetyltransferase
MAFASEAQGAWQMIYRLYKPEDFDLLYAVEEVCFEPPFRFSRRAMRQLVDNPRAATWIAEDGRVEGFAIVEWAEEAGTTIAYIPTIEVAPEKRRSGAGSELLRLLEQSAADAGARVIWLHVAENNTSAIRLYEMRGYRFESREAYFYPKGGAALIYAKPLESRTAENK